MTPSDLPTPAAPAVSRLLTAERFQRLADVPPEVEWFANLERALIVDRTRNGREAAKARGVKFGPRPALTAAQIAHAQVLIDRDGRPVKEATALLGVHRSTFYRALDAAMK
jgi:DNA invertase Pin-like site-specific DNA recombinase